MDKNSKIEFMYQSNSIGLKLLDEVELSGNYLNWFLDEEVNAYNSHFSFPERKKGIKDFVNSLDNDKSKIVFFFQQFEIYDGTHTERHYIGIFLLPRYSMPHQKVLLRRLGSHKFKVPKVQVSKL